MKKINLSKLLNFTKRARTPRLSGIALTKHLVALFILISIVSLSLGYSYNQKTKPLVARQNALAKEVASLKQEQRALQLVAGHSINKIVQPIQEAYGKICEYTSLTSDSLNLKAKIGLPTFSDLGTLETYIKPSDIRGVKSIDLLLTVPADHQTFSYLANKIQTRFPVDLNRILCQPVPGESLQENFQATFTLYGL